MSRNPTISRHTGFGCAMLSVLLAPTLVLAKENLGSVTIGVVSGPDLIWTRSYGFADMEKKRMATKNSVYRIGSITKQFTGFTLLQLAEREKLRLGHPVEKYFPEVNKVQGRIQGAPPITLVQLATMTSGLAREPEDLPTYLKGSVSEWESVLVAALPRTRYEHDPDTVYQYSNIGYAILGAALARAAGQSFVDYVRENFFLPLGMESTAFEPNPKIQEHITKGYAIRDDGKVDWETPSKEHRGRGYKVPNGAIYTTVGNLAKFVAFELSEGPESVLTHKALEENFDRVNSADGDLSSGYGIGFRVSRHGGKVFHGHGGSVAGYRASALFHRASKTGVIVLRNVGGGFNVSDLARRALTEVATAKSRN
jgi:D-alanyl-D-alanine carboxypeptidase